MAKNIYTYISSFLALLTENEPTLSRSILVYAPPFLGGVPDLNSVKEKLDFSS